MALTEADLPNIQQVEDAFLIAWPALRTLCDGDWVWRFAEGYTKRSNSIQSQNPADVENARERLEKLGQMSREAGIVPTFRMTPLAGAEIGDALGALGWQEIEKSRIFASAGIKMVERGRAALVQSPNSDEWLSAQCFLNRYDDKTRQILSRILALMPETAAGITVYDEDGTPAASVLAVSVGDMAMFTNVVTHSAMRRKGYARIAMAEAFAHVKDEGAKRAAIHVLADNPPAHALYKGCGFVDIGGYSYFRDLS